MTEQLRKLTYEIQAVERARVDVAGAESSVTNALITFHGHVEAELKAQSHITQRLAGSPLHPEALSAEGDARTRLARVRLVIAILGANGSFHPERRREIMPSVEEMRSTLEDFIRGRVVTALAGDEE